MDKTTLDKAIESLTRASETGVADEESLASFASLLKQSVETIGKLDERVRALEEKLKNIKGPIGVIGD